MAIASPIAPPFIQYGQCFQCIVLSYHICKNCGSICPQRGQIPVGQAKTTCRVGRPIRGGFALLRLLELLSIVCYTFCMTTASAKIKNSTLELPKTLRSLWRDAEVAIQGDADTLIVKKRVTRLPRRRLSLFGRHLKAAGRLVTIREINAAVRAERRRV